MFKKENQKRLTDIFTQIGKLEIRQEELRQKLCILQLFEPYAAFKRIDREKRQKLYWTDFDQIFQSNGIFVDKKYIQFFLSYHDIENLGFIQYTRFLHIILPQDNPQLRSNVTQKQTYEVLSDEFLPYDLEYALSRVIEGEMQITSQTEYLKILLTSQNAFTIQECFQFIDQKQKGYIDINDIQYFYEKQGYISNNRTYEAICRYLDRDKDGIICLSDFQNSIMPQEQNLQKFLINHEKNKQPYSIKQQQNINQQKIFTNNSINNLNFSKTQINQSPQKKLMNQSVSQTQKMRISNITQQIPAYSYNIRKGSPSPSSDKKIQKSQSAQKLFQQYANLEQRTNLYCNNTNNYQQNAQNNNNNNSYLITNNSKININENYYGSDYNQDNLFQKKVPKCFSRNVISPKKGSSISNTVRQQNKNKQKVQNKDNSQYRQYKQNINKYMQGKQFEYQKKLLKIFRDQLSYEKEIEYAKQDLILQKDFMYKDAFKYFDKNLQGEISQIFFEEKLNDLGIYPDKLQIYLFFRKFDCNHDTYISFEDFLEALLPQQKDFFNLAKDKIYEKYDNQAQNLKEIFSQQTIQKMIKVIEMHLDASSNIENQCLDLCQKDDFEPEIQFEMLDMDQNGQIRFLHLKKFFEIHSVPSLDNELKILFNLLDKDKDDCITYSDFINFINPKTICEN